MMLKRFVKQFNGSSFPTLIETESGENLVIKMRGTGNGPSCLLSEFIANKICSSLNYPVPDVEWIEIPANFPWTFGTDEFDDVVQKSYGWNLGIQYIPGSSPLKTSEISGLDKETINKIFTIDLFFVNVDRSESAVNLLKDSSGKLWIIDHGSLGIFQGISDFNQELYTAHLFRKYFNIKELIFDDRINNKELFSEIIGKVPDEILIDSKTTRHDLFRTIQTRIEKLNKGVYK